jgi:hypothetical protein
VPFKLEDGAIIFVCPSHIHTHKFQTSTITIVVLPALLHCSPLRFLFLQRSQFTEESGKLCNDVVEVSAIDGCYCFLMLATSFQNWRGLLYCAVSHTVWFILLSGFSFTAGSCTAWDLVQHGILYSTGSCTPMDLVQRDDS